MSVDLALTLLKAPALTNSYTAHLNRHFQLFVVIVAAGAIFPLLYLRQNFEISILQSFDITLSQLSNCYALMGLIFAVTYLPSGWLADRFTPRLLILNSLVMTGSLGVWFASIPSYQNLLFIFSGWGISTGLTFWAAHIKIVSILARGDYQGRFFGLLDGGRGLLAAVLASLGVFAFSVAFPLGYDAATLEQKGAVLQQVIYGYTVVTAAVGVLVWFTLRGLDGETDDTQSASTADFFRQIKAVIKLRVVWLQTTVLVCAYTSYKAFDQYALFAVRGHGIDEIDAAQIVATGAWTRPIAALALGLLGDRFGISRMALVCFVLLIMSHSLFAFTGTALGTLSMILLNTLVTGIAIFGLRGLYFGLLEEGKIPLAVTGTAVGLVSVIGYTPDVYIAAVAGYLIDQSPGLAGFQHLFMLLLGFSVVGAIAAIAFERQARASSATAGVNSR